MENSAMELKRKVMILVLFLILVIIILGTFFGYYYSNIPIVANSCIGLILGIITGKFYIKIETYSWKDFASLSTILGIGTVSKFLSQDVSFCYYFITYAAGFILFFIAYAYLGGDFMTMVKKSTRNL